MTGALGQGASGAAGATTGLCPVCLESIPATLFASAGGVVLESRCRDHGCFRDLVSPDPELYREISSVPRKVGKPGAFQTQASRGCPDDCGLCPAHDQRTCLAILEVTERCELGCPVCLAASEPSGRDIGVLEAETALASVIRSNGHPSPLQLGGGEPTLHPRLIEIVAAARSLGFSRIELDTNGILLSENAALCAVLSEAGLTGVYLQMDTLRSDSCVRIRGRDLIREKAAAIRNCAGAGLQVVLGVTVVPGVNDGELWELVEFGVGAGLTGVNFQSLALSGRFPPGRGARFTLVHFLREIERQSSGGLGVSDFNPIPCPDPRCGALAYALVSGGRLIPAGRLIARDALLDHTAELRDWDHLLRDIDWKKAAAESCGCSQPLDFFSVGFHGMMDARSFDAERARRCCVHALTWEGELVPFCLYNIKYRPRGGSRKP